jgi:hypothetical protein
MSSAGHVLDMISRMKNNQALKLQKREHQKKLNELFRKEHQHNENTPIREVEISDENLTKIKTRITRNLHYESSKGSLLTLIITFLVISTIIAIAYLGFLK